MAKVNERLQKENAELRELANAAEDLMLAVRSYINNGKVPMASLDDALLAYELVRFPKEHLLKARKNTSPAPVKVVEPEPEPFMIDMNVPNAWD